MLEDVATVEVTVLIEMIMERGVDGGEFLQGLHVPEFRQEAQANFALTMLSRTYNNAETYAQSIHHARRAAELGYSWPLARSG